MRERAFDYAADAASIAGLVAAGAKMSDVIRQMGWTRYRTRQAFLAINEGLTGQTASPGSEPPAPKEKRKPPRISEIPVIDGDLQPGIVHRFIISGAQDDTPVFEPFLRNLESYAEFLGAHILIGGYTYQLGLFEDHAAEANVYDAAVAPYICHDRVQITPDLLYLGSANVLPTTANPLNGWTTANRGGHVVIPHSRIALESIPRMQAQPPRYATTTGTVTKPNYTARAAGQKSLFHHTYGALVVEIDTDGEVFMRHVVADEKGRFQDLDVYVVDGCCHPGRRVLGVTWGDVHFEQMDETVAEASWGYGVSQAAIVRHDSLLDTLMPEIQFLHDSLDFRRRNHHDAHDPHVRAAIAAHGSASVEQEVAEAAHFINAVTRPWCRTVMVESNHDAALSRWLKNPEGQADPGNAYYWHELNAAWHRAIRHGEDGFNPVEEAMRRGGLADEVEFVRSGGTYTVQGVECGLHGDLGVGGSRGSPNQYRRMGPKVTSGHTHTPKIVDGVYVAGVSARLEQGYNKGPTTWAHAHVVLYRSGKRALICMSADGRHRAIGDQQAAIALAA